MPHSSQDWRINTKKISVGTYCFILKSGSRIALAVDKTIAHTVSDTIRTHRYKNGATIGIKYDVVLLPSSSLHSNLRDLILEDNFNNT